MPRLLSPFPDNTTLWLKEHNVVDWHVGDGTVGGYDIFITQHISAIYVIVFYFKELIKGTMDGIALA
ncbi:MAG: hypothetical protein KBT33_07625 [Prevotellaceae bacterium]|nr:hypothetical protein [Candidatus Minthosoma equi]